MKAVVDGIRSWRERAAQTLWFEGIGLVLVAPLYAWASGSGGGESLLLVATLSLVVMGGMVSSTLLTLIVVPAVYSLVEVARERSGARPLLPRVFARIVWWKNKP